MAERDADAPGSPELPPMTPPSDGHGHGLSIYKSGQGYWTRVCTAIGMAFILLSAAAWLWEQCKLIDIPTPEWALILDANNGGTLDPGATLKLSPQPRADEPPQPFASARVKDVGSTNGRKTITLDNVVFTSESKNLREAKNVASEDGKTFTGHLASVEGLPIFPLVYVQAGAVTLLAVLGGLLTYWLVGIRPRSVDFLIATDAEMKKVNWSTRKTIMDSTWMVVLASVLISTLIYVIDLIFQWFFAFIGVLDH